MTAIGLFMFAIGMFLIKTFGEDLYPILPANRADKIGVWLVWPGALLFVVGCTTYLWRTMP